MKESLVSATNNFEEQHPQATAALYLLGFMVAVLLLALVL